MHWTLRRTHSPPPDPTTLPQLARELQISELLAALLWRRGLMSLRDMDLYLGPHLRHLVPPAQWPGVEPAARVLAQGLEQGLPFAVWGDYDVDGVTATALVTEFLRLRGYAPLPYLPRRMEEGYGMNVAGVEKLAAQGIRLLLTVDCGISDLRPIARAKELGLTVVVSDHHLPGAELPPADAVCNPRLSEPASGDCPCPDLAGVGVAFFLMAALNRMLPGEALDMRRFLDLVALGTLADVVPLKGQNRILVKNGLLLLAEAKRPGLAALKEVSGFHPQAALGAGQVVFSLAPRINAAGRLDDAAKALELLLCPDRDAALPLAQELDRHNTERRAEEERILGEALEQAQAQSHRLGLVLAGADWHQGVIGIVASRVVEAAYKPTLLLCRDDTVPGQLKGSGRSIQECDLFQALQQCADLLAGFGGHRQAAGLRLDETRLEDLRERFHQAVAQQLGPEPLHATQLVDAELDFGRIDFTLLKELELLQPFGMGNPEPVFISPAVLVLRQKVFAEKHVSLDLRDPLSNVVLRAKAWRQAESLGQDLAGKRVRVAFTPRVDTYRGTPSIELNIRGLVTEHGVL